MDEDITQFISTEKKKELQEELSDLRGKKIPDLAKRIDEARQMGDLSENAEYHQAREDMAWAQSRAAQIDSILESSQISTSSSGGVVRVGSTIVVESKGKKKEFTIVGAQEADPLAGRISNESPLGQAFTGRKKGEAVDVEIPAGRQTYLILEVK